MDAPRIEFGLPRSFEDLATQGISTQSHTPWLKNCLWNAATKISDIARGIFASFWTIPAGMLGGAVMGLGAWIMFMSGQAEAHGSTDEKVALVFLAISVGAGTVLGGAMGAATAFQICKGSQQDKIIKD